MAKSGTDEVIAMNPATGKTSRFTRKAFDGVYKEKGFELVDRDNADKATAAGSRTSKGQQRASAGNKAAAVDDGDDEGSAGGGAASIAKSLELDEK